MNSNRTAPEGSVLTPGGWVEGSVEIAGNAIASIRGRALPRGESPKAPFIIPGFIDLHVHGGGGADWQGGEEGVRAFVGFHASHGTTAIAPTTATGPVRVIERALSAIASVAAAPGPGESLVLGAHLEGPFVNPKKPGAMNPAHMLDADPALARRWAETCPIVVATVAPEIRGGCDVVRALAERGCRVQIGHSVAAPDEIDRSFQCGCSGFTHLFNAMTGVEHRAPGVAAYAMAKGQYAEIICDMIHVDPIVVLAARRAIPGLYAITDASAAGLADGEFEWGGHRIVKRGLRVTLTDGKTLAGSAITMLDAFRNLVSLGVSLEEAVDMTSRRQADYLGRNDLGRIEAGARACLIRLGDSLDLEGIWV
ncbi:MAG: amidohydrolase family protein, partial [Hyphomicrobiales bacterium]|nr:amidohydrolase family protein [Hyphomicrobiales bacterium]